ncbi:SDR family oxidoreductase [Streptomyces sp. NPDC001443]
MKTILVLGGTGTTGRRIARRLTADGRPVRTACRTGGDVHFDLDDPATWAPALDGAAAVYLVEPNLQPGVDRQARIPRLVTDAVAAGVRRLVLLSAHGVGQAGDGHPPPATTTSQAVPSTCVISRSFMTSPCDPTAHSGKAACCFGRSAGPGRPRDSRGTVRAPDQHLVQVRLRGTSVQPRTPRWISVARRLSSEAEQAGCVVVAHGP